MVRIDSSNLIGKNKVILITTTAELTHADVLKEVSLLLGIP